MSAQTTSSPSLTTLSTITVPDLPRETPTMPTSDAPAAPPAAGPDLDRLGAAWDAARHESPARLNARGAWALLRGNAARRAKGLPLTGASVGATPRPRPAAPANDQAPAMASDTGGADPVQDATPDLDEPTMAPEDFKATADGIARGTFAAAALVIGPAWNPEPDECPALSGALQRVWHHYQLPRLGPVPELIAVLIPIIARRRSDPATQSIFRRILAILGLYRSTPPAPPTPAGMTESRAVTAP